MAHVRVEREIAGRTLTIETGKIAKLTAGAAWLHYGETVVLVAVATGKPRPGIDFFPLTVDYREKTYAAGKIPGGFFKREARPSNQEILTMRMIDRPIRPLFHPAYRDEVVIQAMVLSHDQENDPDILSVIGASTALMVAGMPFDGPLAAVRVGRVDGKFVFNPTIAQREFSDMDLVLGGHEHELNMIEFGGHEVPEADVLEAMKQGHEIIQEVCGMQREMVERLGNVKPIWTAPEPNDAWREKLHQRCYHKFRELKQIPGKNARNEAVSEFYAEVLDEVSPEGAENPEISRSEAWEIVHYIEELAVRDLILETGKRPDGRGASEIRDLESEVGVLPRTHGSAIFQRGETQALVTATLGTVRDEQIIDGLIEEYSKKFMLHYNFPPICVGEARRVGPTSRREVGHGNLAEKSLQAVLPPPEEFPYTIRIVSDILESNGSSSMASVCGGTLALMDAGVPIRQPVAGISIGQFHDDEKHLMVVDILGEEDHFGDMDFKVAGTGLGITGIQVDLKTRGISMERIEEAMELAKKARKEILRSIIQCIERPRPEISRHAPRILSIKIPPDKIGRIIGPGGKNIKSIESQTGAKVEIEEDGTIFVSAVDAQAAEAALQLVENASAEARLHKIYEGRVASVTDFGAFVEIMPGVDGLCHISELSEGFVKNVSDVCKVGDRLKVKVIQIDEQGRIKLSKRAADAEVGVGADS